MKRIGTIRVIIVILLSLVASGGFFISPVNAQLFVNTKDESNIWVHKEGFNWEKAEERAEDTWQTAASKAFHSALSGALNTIAYDTATYIGKGGKGKEPLFIKENWGEYMANVADNSAGRFLEELGQRESFMGEFNLCKPDTQVKVKIGLGLKDYARPEEPECSFTEVREEWDKYLKEGDFLNEVQDMFDPASSEFGMALELKTEMVEQKEKDKEEAENKREENEGWLDVRNIAGERQSAPGEAERRREAAGATFHENMTKYTGDALVDSINVFLNRLALTAFQTLMASLGKDMDKTTSPYSGDFGGFESSAGGSNSNQDYQNRLREMAKPNFTVRGDYNILSDLSSCPDPNNPKTTNCVISDSFRQAISKRLTVGEAMEKGYLNPEGAFGFLSGGLEPKYNEAYPYRSLIILRKYRIIPVGWGLAAQYIKDHFDEVNGTKNLKQMVACYEQDDEFEGYYEEWCSGLVDPDWVLKAPQNYCGREGPGPHIMTQKVTGKDEDSKLNVSRQTDYCADEQTCIQKSPQGSCQYYGYCTRDQRTWEFDAPSCDSQFNTCQTFRSPEQGSKVSYLKNTLEYGPCGSDNAGCQAYSVYDSSIDYNVATDTLVWSTSSEMYFDQDADTCNPEQEGCQELIRIHSGSDANILRNSGFERDLSLGDWSSLGSVSTSSSYNGSRSLQMDGSTEEKTVSVKDDFGKRGKRYTLSLYARDCDGGSFRIMGEENDAVEFEGSDSDWTRYSDSYAFHQSDPSASPDPFGEEPGSDQEIKLKFNTGSNCLIDAVKLERGGSASGYTAYGETGVIQEKLLPDYLSDGGHCYNDEGELKDEAPSSCFNYARTCDSEEAGCRVYTALNDSYQVVARTVAQNRCPRECAGFNVYTQSETPFEGQETDYLIPRTAKTCSPAAAGCDEFTNLDEVGQGAENREYYSRLKECVDIGHSDCKEFYTWHGDAQGGEQLVSHTLKADDGEGPEAISGVSGECNETVYTASSTDPIYNPDCRKFYDQDKNSYYRLTQEVITCSENCHPYRRTRDGETYMAIPGQGEKCSAPQAGCREYVGNQGNNTRILFTYGFESEEEADAWSGGSLSSASVVAGENSLEFSDPVENSDLPVVPARGQTYKVEFLANFDNKNNVNISFEHTDGSTFEFRTLESENITDGEWKLYETYLKEPLARDEEDLEISSSTLSLVISGTSGNLDDVRLTEVSDRYYLIKDSWNTPESCNQNIYGEDEDHYMLGCQAYQNPDQPGTQYLHSFDRICDPSSAGCEMMIDTHNSDSPFQESGTDPDYDIPSDDYIYAVYDPDKTCNSAAAGCERMGEKETYEGQLLYQDTYIVNNPDNYQEILCQEEAEGCRAWKTEDQGESYFKDPQDQVCKWRKAQPSGEDQSQWGWYKKKISRCDLDSNGQVDNTDPVCNSASDCGVVADYEDQVCSSDDDCDSDPNNDPHRCVEGTCYYSCQKEQANRPCPTDVGQGMPPKTLGVGGPGHGVSQPWGYMNGGEWVGLCPSGQSGCTEYIDPESEFNPNLFDTRYDDPIAEITVDTEADLRIDDRGGVPPEIDDALDVRRGVRDGRQLAHVDDLGHVVDADAVGLLAEAELEYLLRIEGWGRFGGHGVLLALRRRPYLILRAFQRWIRRRVGR